MALKAGSLEPGNIDLEGSMVAAMETAFRENWPYVMGDAPVPEFSKQMKLMFVAIASGVINHLSTNSDSMQVTITSGNTGTVSNIVTT